MSTAAPVLFKCKSNYGFLSNLYQCSVHLWGITFPTSEHAYHWAKAYLIEDEVSKERILSITNPWDAMDFGKHILRPGSSCCQKWSLLQYHVMFKIVSTKFFQHPQLFDKLKTTGSRQLIEDTPHSVWGRGTTSSPGRNLMGQILSRVREGQLSSDLLIGDSITERLARHPESSSLPFGIIYWAGGTLELLFRICRLVVTDESKIYFWGGTNNIQADNPFRSSEVRFHKTQKTPLRKNPALLVMKIKQEFKNIFRQYPNVKVRFIELLPRFDMPRNTTNPLTGLPNTEPSRFQKAIHDFNYYLHGLNDKLKTFGDVDVVPMRRHLQDHYLFVNDSGHLDCHPNKKGVERILHQLRSYLSESSVCSGEPSVAYCCPLQDQLSVKSDIKRSVSNQTILLFECIVP